MARTVIALSPHDRGTADIVQSPRIKNKETTTVKITRRTKPRIKNEANHRVQTRATITPKKEVGEIHHFFVNLNHSASALTQISAVTHIYKHACVCVITTYLTMYEVYISQNGASTTTIVYKY